MGVRDRVVAVLGAGNLRCSPSVLGSLATWTPDDLVTIRLFDASEERLDLFDRFLRECLDLRNLEHSVVSTTSAPESLEDATDVVFTIYEECARLMRGREALPLFDPASDDSASQVRGDPNKPTPPMNLSQHTRSILSSPAYWEGTREQAIESALERLLEHVPPEARSLSLVRGVSLATAKTTLLDWPEPVTPNEMSVVPHQVLRWIHGEETLEPFLVSCATSPFVQWLDSTS